MIYFIRMGASRGPVKIGYSQTEAGAYDRLGSLQVGNPEDLYMEAVIPGELTDERRLHGYFADHRLRGEWFGADAPGLRRLVSRAIASDVGLPDVADELTPRQWRRMEAGLPAE